MKRTNVVLDEELVDELKERTGIATTRELVNFALRELRRHRRLCEFRKLRGKIHWEGDLDEMRKDRVFD